MKIKCRKKRLLVLAIELVIIIALFSYLSASYLGNSSVNESILSLNKTKYPLGEEVYAYITNPENIKEISIIGENFKMG